MKFSTFALALVASISPVLGFPAPSAEAIAVRAVAAPQNFSITSVGVLGTGCPSGTAWHALSTDRSSVTVGFSKLYAEVGPKIAVSSNRRTCLVTFGVRWALFALVEGTISRKLRIPGGFSLGVASVETRGWYQLDTAVTASQQSKYYFQGLLQEATARKDLVGPVAEYVFNDAFDIGSIAISPCGANTALIIQTELRTSNSANKQGTGYIATDSISTSLQQTFNFNFFPCRL
ncbi:hypothetical protein BKA70DRAFT_1418479 [Coprinopsis sp. MPI-PUGE-AT-0042]|nr:hypothetical protein BKA70DRAFT_1418479 [Coprinopsis sp. MPI-PUGE-AT-0042]